MSGDGMSGAGKILVTGDANGRVLYADASLSFWGGINIKTGVIIDRHHPLFGKNVKGRVLTIPGGRGSCTGSGAMLELLMNDCAPAALIFASAEQIITLGVLIARAMFEKSIPVLVLDRSGFVALKHQPAVTVDAHGLVTEDKSVNIQLHSYPAPSTSDFQLSAYDQKLLSGSRGEAAKIAMEILVQCAQMQGADSLIDITQSHIDACIYVGPSSLLFPQKLVDMGAKLAVPTTLNSLSVDRRRWRELGMQPHISVPASAVADAYLQMGASVSFTCAPYLLETAPKPKENIGWAESNAVVFANSVLGARTQKYPDFLDVFIALTGRAPNAGCHTDAGRVPIVHIHINLASEIKWDDSLFCLAGYCVGERINTEIPFITGMENTNPTTADLKAFSAAIATASSTPMFHMRNVTPEAWKAGKHHTSLKRVDISVQDLRDCWLKLNSTATDSSVALVSLGNPHFALEEFKIMAGLVKGRHRHVDTQVVITSSREIYGRAERAGYFRVLEQFGINFITDTCWCMLDEPVIPLHARNLMTNSAKYAHYGTALTGRGMRFGSLAMCVDVAEAGFCDGKIPGWLEGE